MNNNINPDMLFQVLKSGGIKGQNVNQLISSLNDSDKQMLNRLLRDKKARDELLASKEVQMLLNSFMKKDGK